MSFSSEDETDISDSELEEYVDRCYEQLRDESGKVRYSDELYRCPFCPGKKKLVYPFNDILQHASDVGKGSQNKDIKHKGKHLGLVRYLKEISPDNDNNLSSQFEGLTLDKGNGINELFVWPWMGVLANVDDESISKIKNDLVKGGFDPVRVRPLPRGGYAVVEFKRDWSGFHSAITFEKEFEVNQKGKKDYNSKNANLGDKLYYGWVARDDDYNSNGVLGEYLHKHGDLKTVADVEGEEKRKTSLLVADLSKTIEELRMRLDELECNHREPRANLVDVGSQKD